jgi:hypothetical protein
MVTIARNRQVQKQTQGNNKNYNTTENMTQYKLNMLLLDSCDDQNVSRKKKEKKNTQTHTQNKTKITDNKM